MAATVNVNGQIFDEHHAVISVFDHGFLYGEGVYETLRTYNGLPFLFEVPRMAFFDCGGVRLMLGLPDAPEFDHPASILYYRVADIDAAHAALVARGVSFRQPPHRVARLATADLYLADFRDSEGNACCLMSEVARAEAGPQIGA